jgi:hypothetical protein
MSASTRIIHHYLVPPTERAASHRVPAGTKVLAAMLRDGVPTLYVQKFTTMDDNYVMNLETFFVPTGEEFRVDNGFEYVGTVTNPADNYFYHVFARLYYA